MDQWNKIENSEINPCTYGKLNQNKGGKTTECWKIVSLTNGTGKIGQLHVKKKENEIRSFFNNIHNISTQIIKNLEDWKP